MPDFTSREKDILRLLIEGKTNTEIGSELYISFHTVKAILENIYNKIGCKNRMQAAVFVIKNNIKLD